MNKNNNSIDCILDKMELCILHIKNELAKKDYEKMNDQLENFNGMIGQFDKNAMSDFQELRYDCQINEYVNLLRACLDQAQIDRLNRKDSENFL